MKQSHDPSDDLAIGTGGPAAAEPGLDPPGLDRPAAASAASATVDELPDAGPGAGHGSAAWVAGAHAAVIGVALAVVWWAVSATMRDGVQAGVVGVTGKSGRGAAVMTPPVPRALVNPGPHAQTATPTDPAEPTPGASPWAKASDLPAASGFTPSFTFEDHNDAASASASGPQPVTAVEFETPAPPEVLATAMQTAAASAIWGDPGQMGAGQPTRVTPAARVEQAGPVWYGTPERVIAAPAGQNTAPAQVAAALHAERDQGPAIPARANAPSPTRPQRRDDRDPVAALTRSTPKLPPAIRADTPAPPRPAVQWIDPGTATADVMLTTAPVAFATPHNPLMPPSPRSTPATPAPVKPATSGPTAGVATQAGGGPTPGASTKQTPTPTSAVPAPTPAAVLSPALPTVEVPALAERIAARRPTEPVVTASAVVPAAPPAVPAVTPAKPAAAKPITHPAPTEPPATRFAGSFYGLPAGRSNVYLIDASGSLIDTLPYALDELRRALRTLAPTQEYAVVFFRGDTVVEAEPAGLRAATPENLAQTLAWLEPDRNNLRPFGQTDASAALAHAMSYEPQVLFLLSDGITGRRDPAGDRRRLVSLVERFAGRTVFHTVQFVDPDVFTGQGKMGTLELLANATLGEYRYISADQARSAAR